MAQDYNRIIEKDINKNQLQSEINSNSLIIASCIAISQTETNYTFTFAAALSTEEEQQLDVMINNHTPEATLISVSQLPLSTDTNKLAVQHSAKPMIIGSITYVVWTGAGDDMDSGEIGGGELLNFVMQTGTTQVSKNVKFHSSNGRVWINEGYMKFHNAGLGDYITSCIMAPASQLQQLINLDLTVDVDGWIKYSTGGPGTGTHGFAATPVLIPRLYSRDGDWDFDGTNLTPNFTGHGQYKMKNVECVIHKYVNKIPLYGTNASFSSLSSDDTAELIYPYFVRITAYNTSNTDWDAQIFLEIFREKTCE